MLKAAEICPAKMLPVVMRISYSDFSSFWFSCTSVFVHLVISRLLMINHNTDSIGSCIVFATVSNFTILFLVQAPTKDHAVGVKRLLDTWREKLQIQSRSFSKMNMRLVGLDGPLWSGLSTNYYFPRHVKEV